MSANKIFVLSLGGSLLVPANIDTGYLRKFKNFIEQKIGSGLKFIIIAGGGATARKYRDAGIAVVKAMPVDDLDWLGIHSTRLNAHLIRTIFRKHAYSKLLLNPAEKIPRTIKPILVGAGYWPGHSTDYQAVMFAKKFGAPLLINLSNIDYVYSQDPKKSGAKKIEKISWPEFKKIVGKKWDPGLHAPFDPIASRIAARAGLKVAVVNGWNFSNLNNLLSGKKFKGTMIY